MSYVEIRNQERRKVIKKIRSLLLPGDMVKIQQRAGKSYRAVFDTLSEKHPLYSQAVIDAAWQYLEEIGRTNNKITK